MTDTVRRMTDDDVQQQIARGFEVAHTAILAGLRDDQRAALDAINGATHPELAWATGRMLGVIYSLAKEVAGGDTERAYRLVRDALEGNDDLVDTQLRMLTPPEDDQSP